jgi:hypothetical protein
VRAGRAGSIFGLTRSAEEYVTLFSKAALEGMNVAAVPVEEMRLLLRQTLRETVVRFGEGRLNPITVTCVIQQIGQILRAEM